MMSSTSTYQVPVTNTILMAKNQLESSVEALKTMILDKMTNNGFTQYTFKNIDKWDGSDKKYPWLYFRLNPGQACFCKMPSCKGDVAVVPSGWKVEIAMY